MVKKQTMANTYSQIYIQVVFAVRDRESSISEKWDEKLYQYITGIVTNKNQKMLAINGAHDHIHFLIGMKPDCCLSDLVREIKKSSNSFIKEQKFCKSAFYWQAGFGAFSYSRNQIDTVINYILNQKEHHKSGSFKDEYLDLLKSFDVEFDERYLFQWQND